MPGPTDEGVLMTCYEQYIFLAPHEWGNQLMRQVAEAFLRAHPEVSPLVVLVYEHAGWCLAFTLLDGQLTVVGSANDAAVFHGKAKEFRQRTHSARWTPLGPAIRRGEEACSAPRCPEPPAGA
jgi:hypothetical protein